MAENMSASNAKKGRKWVITGMVIFLVVLGLLTFFSNTIMNATIPKVMGVYGNRGNLSYTNSATGVIEADQKVEIKGVDGREVEEVMVYNYQNVSAGEVLYTLKPVEDETALEALRTQLQELEREAEYDSRRPSNPTDYTSYQEGIVAAQEALEEAQATLNLVQNRDAVVASSQATVSEVSSRIPGLQSTLDAETATVSSINAQITELETQIATIESQITTLVTIGVPTPTPRPDDYVFIYDPAMPTPTPAPQQTEERIGQLQDEILALEAQIEILNEQLSSAQARVDSASAALAEAQSELDAAQAILEQADSLPSLTSAQSAVNLAVSGLAQARRAYSEAQINDGIAADQAHDAVEDRNQRMEDLREQIEKAEADMELTEVVAPSDGFVFNLSVGANDPLTKDMVTMQIIPNDATYSVSFKFDATAVQSFYQGMELTVDSYYIDRCIVEVIRPDESNPRESRIVKCSLQGDWIWPGESITVTADRGNQNYDCVVPSSAVNEDNSGTFVYVIEESTSPLGKKYVVKRVSVTVEANSGAYCAISGENLDGNQIVTRSEKPLNDGDRVRLEDYSGGQG